jgi:hypothetical protein
MLDRSGILLVDLTSIVFILWIVLQLSAPFRINVKRFRAMSATATIFLLKKSVCHDQEARVH